MTELEILIFDEMRSDLDNCYSEIAVNVSTKDITVRLTPTPACIFQIVDSEMDTNSYVYNAVANVGGFEFELSLIGVINAY